MSIVAGLIVLFLGALFGTLILASSEMPIAVREIAINTRRDKSTGSSYTFLMILSIALKIIAVIIILLGCVAAFAIVAAWKDLPVNFPFK
ncbi:MAG: hypothetical protein JW969_19650 [Spirochaetales bacterium]|nr:hypothetical protein [Spirochaetales bacterium]